VFQGLRAGRFAGEDALMLARSRVVWVAVTALSPSNTPPAGDLFIL
jgi:hypothetical protein